MGNQPAGAKAPTGKTEGKDAKAPGGAAKPDDSAKPSNPPAYDDLGKVGKKLFKTGFNYGRYEIRYRSKTEGGIEIGATGTCQHESGAVVALLCAKKSWKEKGVTLILKGSNEQKLTMCLSTEDCLTKGMKQSANFDFVPLLSQSKVQLKSAYQNSFVNTSLGFEFLGTNMLRSVVVGSLVTGWKDCYLGVQMGYDVGRRATSKIELAAAHYWSDTTILLSTSNFQEAQLLLYQKVNDSTEVGAEFSGSRGAYANKINFVGKYNFGKDIILKAMLNTQQELGLSAEMKIVEGVSITCSTLVQGHHLSEACHKFGFGLEIQL